MTDGPYRSVERHEIGDAGPVSALALRGDRLAVGAGPRVTTTTLSGGRNAGDWSRELDWTARRLELSHSGRFLLAESEAGGELEIWDLVRDCSAGRFGSPVYGQPRVTGAFLHGSDVVVVSPSTYELEARALASEERIFAADTRRPRAFAVRRIVAAADGDSLVAVGRYFSEMNDSLLVFSLARLAADPAAAAETTVTREPFHDYAWLLVAGPCGPDEVVVFRDPEDTEEPDDEDEDEDDEDEDEDELYGYRGLYVRSLRDGRIVERIAYDGPLGSADQLLGTPRVVAVGSREQLDLVPRGASAQSAVRVPAAAIALDPAGARVAYVEPSSGTLQVLAL